MISKIKNILHTDNKDFAELISKSGISLFIRIIGMLLMYIFFYLVSNFFGAGAVGVYSLCFAVLNIGVVFSHLGFHTAALRYISEFEAKNNWAAIRKTYGITIKVPVLLSVIISLLIYFNAGFIGKTFFGDEAASENIQWVAYSILPLTLVLIHVESLRALRKIRESAFLQNVTIQLISILVLFVPIYLNIFDDNIPFLTRVIANIFTAIYCVWYWLKLMKSQPTSLTPNFDDSGSAAINLRMMATMALPLFLASSTRLIMDWSDTLMLGIFTTNQEVGIYNTALKVAMLTNLPLLAVNSIAAPKFSALYHNGMIKEFKEYVQLATNLNCYTTLPMILVLALFPGFVLGFFGEEFLEGRTTLWLLLGGQLVNTFSGSVGYILQMTNRQHIFQRLMLLATLLNVALNYWLIPIWGIDGAATASMISMGSWNLAAAAFIYYKMDVVTVFRPSLTLILRFLKNQNNNA